jgi:hypothetical protein
MKRFHEEQATVLLAQQLQLDEQRKLFEEERTQLLVERAILIQEQNVILQQNAKQAKELEEHHRLLEDKEA